MKERGILFNGAMVRAVLREVDPKWQTRRALKPQWPADVIPKEHSSFPGYWIPYGADRRLRNDLSGSRKGDCGIYCPYGQPGDRLWVRETWEHYGNHFNAGRASALIMYRDEMSRRIERDEVPYREADEWLKWRPSIHMPRWASRITLEITSVRVERVQDISEEDALAEGCEEQWSDEVERYLPARSTYAALWDKLNKSRGYSWQSNCWVWVLSFQRVEP